jgi:tRNA-2-methylthio-N6-dimethylallyladenosine synthase
MPYLHLPVQAGSDRILKAMNRHHSVADYLQIIERVRESRPDIAISGDFIVGFPGETEEEFQETLAVVETVKYASAFSFNYSSRPGTPGADLPDQVPEDVKSERLQRLQSALNRHQLAFNEGCVGTTMTILLEKKGRKPGQWIGRSPFLQSVVVDEGLGKPGDMVQVLITGAAPNSLTGEGIDRSPY